MERDLARSRVGVGKRLGVIGNDRNPMSTSGVVINSVESGRCRACGRRLSMSSGS
jgi:hypothetical protein